MKSKWKKLPVVLIGIIAIAVCGCSNDLQELNQKRSSAAKENTESTETVRTGTWETAAQTPYGAYPELVTYTLGQMSGANNSNLPDGNTYDDNAYTRYLRKILNIQNKSVYMEREDRYDEFVNILVKDQTLPDVLVVSDRETLKELVDNDLVEDLSEVYENCTSERIKKMFESYGSGLLDSVRFNGKLMAIPETVTDHGPRLMWLRKDWMDKLGLTAPKTIEDVVDIIRAFIEKDPGNNGTDNNGRSNTVGLVIDTELTGECGYSSEFLLDIVFACYNAYPKQWIKDSDGNVVYGSVTSEAKDALAYIRQLYSDGIIDNDFLLRTTTNICELIENGRCGSFFGPWWAPNNPLVNAVNTNPDADWQPYLIQTSDDGSTSYHSQNPCYKYVVVRKGFEHPEIAAKIISVMFDSARYDSNALQEFIYYYQQNVEPTARPISINVDYNNALSICYEKIDKALKGESDPDKLELLEKSYYDACSSYISNTGKNYIESSTHGSDDTLERKNATSTEWAAYVSRITACRLLSEGNIRVVDSMYFKTTDTMKTRWWRLKEKKKEAYLKIICGAEDISYFDTFVNEWNEQGGEAITNEVREELIATAG